jgi:hypothetical protein
MRIQSTATTSEHDSASTIDEPASEGRSPPGAKANGGAWRSRYGGRHAVVRVVGGSRLERGGGCEDGRTTRNRPEFTVREMHWKSRRVEVRAPIRAEMQGNACGAKGGRKAEAADRRRCYDSWNRLLHGARTPAAKVPAPESGNCLHVPPEGRRWGASQGHPALRHVSSLRGKLLTGEPDAGEPLVRFGGRGDANQCAVPTPIQRYTLRSYPSRGLVVTHSFASL